MVMASRGIFLGDARQPEGQEGDAGGVEGWVGRGGRLQVVYVLLQEAGARQTSVSGFDVLGEEMIFPVFLGRHGAGQAKLCFLCRRGGFYGRTSAVGSLYQASIARGWWSVLKYLRGIRRMRLDPISFGRMQKLDE